MERENSDDELANLKKRSIHDEARSLWDEMNGRPGEMLYAGEFDQ